MVDRVLRAFTPDDLQKIAGTFAAWKRGKDYADVRGFCKSATKEDIEKSFKAANATGDMDQWAKENPSKVAVPVRHILIGKGTVILDDFSQADAIFVIGQNPGTNSPRMLTELRNASRRGVPIVVLNPLPSAIEAGRLRRLVLGSSLNHEYSGQGEDRAASRGAEGAEHVHHASGGT